jgi:hypothetical protein
MSIQRASINVGREQNGFAEVRSSHGYKLLNDSRTVSKSAQSKIKNLAYTLGSPFRAVMRQLIQSRAGSSGRSAEVINIKSTPLPRYSSAENKPESHSKPDAAYEVIEITQGSRGQSLLGRIWG